MILRGSTRERLHSLKNRLHKLSESGEVLLSKTLMALEISFSDISIEPKSVIGERSEKLGFEKLTSELYTELK